MAKFPKEFQEIAHSGGKYVVEISSAETGELGYSIGYEAAGTGPLKLFGIYALPQGIPVDTIVMGGIGQQLNPAPHESCYIVMVGSDKTGMFGHECTDCSNYWRSGSAPSRWNMICPRCGRMGKAHQFRTKGQLAYIRECCLLIAEAIEKGRIGRYYVDMDKAIDLSRNNTDRPIFYYTEESQQTSYVCNYCGENNDIIGRFGYCSTCRTKNTLTMTRADIERLRKEIGTSSLFSKHVCSAISIFDGAVESYASEMIRDIPMTRRRRNSWPQRYHDLSKVVACFGAYFDIDLFDGIKLNDQLLMTRMFHRRHVYEHRRGEVDQSYLDKSHDDTVRLGQLLTETKDNAFIACEMVNRMLGNLHEGFHDIFPPETTLIEAYRRRAASGLKK